MEWMLQVLDECDDAGAALCFWWLGARRAIGVVTAGLAGVTTAICALLLQH
jgi:hypothetical protein